MPDTSESNSDDELLIDLSESPDQAEPLSSDRWQTVRYWSEFFAQNLLKPYGTALISAYAMYNLLTSVSEGFPLQFNELARGFAKYQIPTMAVPTVLLGALDAADVPAAKVPNRIAISAMTGISVANYSIPMIMELLSLIVDGIKHQPRTSPVYIPDWAAALVVVAMTCAGTVQAIQSDYLKINAEDPEAERSLLNRITTHQGMLIVSAALSSSSGIHGVVMALQRALGFNPQDNAEFYSRIGISLGFGLAGSVILGRPNSETSQVANVFKTALTGAVLTAVGIGFLGTFYFSPDAVDILTHYVINLQTVLWSAIEPLIPITIIMLQLAGYTGPDLQDAFIEKFALMTEAMTQMFITDNRDRLNINADLQMDYGTIGETFEINYSRSNSPASSSSDSDSVSPVRSVRSFRLGHLASQQGLFGGYSSSASDTQTSSDDEQAQSDGEQAQSDGELYNNDGFLPDTQRYQTK